MLQKKNIVHGKISSLIFVFIFIFILFFSISNSQENSTLEGKFVELKILDKVSSKNTTLELEIGTEQKFQKLSIKVLKCKNSEFDDDPEITAYMQVRDLADKNNDKVFVFNGWTFASSPSLRPFDHPVYDIWLTKCLN